MEKTINGVVCRVVDSEWDIYFDMAMTMLEEIIENNKQNKPTVMIVPVGPTQQYPILAKMVNRLGVSLRSRRYQQGVRLLGESPAGNQAADRHL